jgi:hypothetical protein
VFSMYPRDSISFQSSGQKESTYLPMNLAYRKDV